MQKLENELRKEQLESKEWMLKYEQERRRREEQEHHRQEQMAANEAHKQEQIHQLEIQLNQIEVCFELEYNFLHISRT